MDWGFFEKFHRRAVTVPKLSKHREKSSNQVKSKDESAVETFQHALKYPYSDNVEDSHNMLVLLSGYSPLTSVLKRSGI